MLILLVDDDRALVDLLAFALRREGLEAVPAYDAAMALDVFETRQPDLVVLDLNLGGGGTGLDVLKALRARSQVPVIILTAADGEEDKVRGLNLGADDYVTKPFSHKELIARIQAHLRRAGIEPPTGRPRQTRWEVGPIMLDTTTHSVFKNGQRVDLTVTEFRLLSVLIQHAGTVVPTATLLEQVWGDTDPAGAGDLVRVTVHRLRRKLEDDPACPELLHTIPGVGFLFGSRP
jgi:two-component system, OmpR family, response regulator RegX3